MKLTELVLSVFLVVFLIPGLLPADVLAADNVSLEKLSGDRAVIRQGEDLKILEVGASYQVPEAVPTLEAVDIIDQDKGEYESRIITEPLGVHMKLFLFPFDEYRKIKKVYTYNGESWNKNTIEMEVGQTFAWIFFLFGEVVVLFFAVILFSLLRMGFSRYSDKGDRKFNLYSLLTLVIVVLAGAGVGIKWNSILLGVLAALLVWGATAGVSVPYLYSSVTKSDKIFILFVLPAFFLLFCFGMYFASLGIYKEISPQYLVTFLLMLVLGFLMANYFPWSSEFGEGMEVMPKGTSKRS